MQWEVEETKHSETRMEKTDEVISSRKRRSKGHSTRGIPKWKRSTNQNEQKPGNNRHVQISE